MSNVFSSSFSDGIDGWRHWGDAVFSVDHSVGRTEPGAARIEVKDGAPLEYQQLILPLSVKLVPGDRFDAEAWIHDKIAPGGRQAYIALEFRKGGKRLTIHHRMGEPRQEGRWRQIVIQDATVPKGAEAVHLLLILHAHGVAWFDDIKVTRRRVQLKKLPREQLRHISIDAAHLVSTRFAGVGFHLFHPLQESSQEHLHRVIVKRWRELNPSFARVTDMPDADSPCKIPWKKSSWISPEQMARVGDHLVRLKEDTQTEVYLTTWFPPDVPAGAPRKAYAKQVADHLEYYIRERGADNIKWYCMTNELCLNQWADLIRDRDTFEDYHREIHAEIQRRDLPVQLLATDASPISNWWTLDWAVKELRDITGIYGGHHYINGFLLDDPVFYHWFRKRAAEGVAMAKRGNGDFILGEFGCKQDGRTIDGVRQDRCIYWDTPEEPTVAIQLAEAVIASIQSGIYGLAYWTFSDFPSDWQKTGVNQWGVFRWEGKDYSTRDHYYAYGLLTKFLRGPSVIPTCEVKDDLMRVGGVLYSDGTVSLAIVNRNPFEVQFECALAAIQNRQPLRRYDYDTRNVPQNRFGDLQSHSALIDASSGTFRDSIGPDCLAVYTTQYQDLEPGQVENIKLEKEGQEGIRVSWEAPKGKDPCYYRVYRLGSKKEPLTLRNQIASTAARFYLDPDAGSDAEGFAVVAVDRSGNAGKMKFLPK